MPHTTELCSLRSQARVAVVVDTACTPSTAAARGRWRRGWGEKWGVTQVVKVAADVGVEQYAGWCWG